MLVRIVKMTFTPEHTTDFVALFNERKQFIAASEGCEGVELLRDIANPNIFFTYSQWQSEKHLNQYRHSTLFDSVWATVKQWFAEKPEAWSVETVSSS
jgi:quinol monooxygenase YgiN